MKELVILSGKGGTGKTTFSASLAYLAAPAITVDCDVNASNLHILLPHKTQVIEDVYLGQESEINPGLCTGCGLCFEACRFHAIQKTNRAYYVNTPLCEGCGVCSLVCPEHAVSMNPAFGGQWMCSETAVGTLYHAELASGGENSGKLVSILRREAREAAQKENHDLIICDGPPGIGCPVIASLTGTDRALLVTEPSIAAVHDLKRIIQLLHRMSIPAGVCINRWDVSPKLTEDIEQYCKKEGIEPLGRIRYDRGLIDSQKKGTTPLELDTPAAGDIQQAAERIIERIYHGTEIT